MRPHTAHAALPVGVCWLRREAARAGLRCPLPRTGVPPLLPASRSLRRAARCSVVGSVLGDRGRFGDRSFGRAADTNHAAGRERGRSRRRPLLLDRDLWLRFRSLERLRRDSLRRLRSFSFSFFFSCLAGGSGGLAFAVVHGAAASTLSPSCGSSSDSSSSSEEELELSHSCDSVYRVLGFRVSRVKGLGFRVSG